MNEKKTITISVTSLFLVIAILVIIGMGYFMYNMYQEKQIAFEEVNQLNSELSTVKNTIDNLQNTLTSTSENTTTENLPSNNSDSTTQTTTPKNPSNTTQNIEQECRTILEKFLPIYGSGSPDAVLVNANLLTYEDLNNAEQITNNYIKTSLGYSDFKNALLEYITSDYFEEYYGTIDYKSGQKAFINSNGFLAILNAGASGMSFDIQTMKLISNKNNVITYEITYIDPDLEATSPEIFHLTATFKSSNNGIYRISNLDFNN